MAAAVRMVVAARAEAEAVTEVAMEAAAMEAAAREAAAAEEATARRREGGGGASGPCRARTSACRSRVAARCRGTWRR